MTKISCKTTKAKSVFSFFIFFKLIVFGFSRTFFLNPYHGCQSYSQCGRNPVVDTPVSRLKPIPSIPFAQATESKRANGASGELDI